MASVGATRRQPRHYPRFAAGQSLAQTEFVFFIKNPHKSNGQIKRKRLRQRTTEMILGTWNVLSLCRPGAIHQLISEIERYHIDILAIQETRWVDNGVSKMGKYTYMFSGRSDNKHERGTGFIVHEKIAQHISDFKPINDRICLLTIALKKSKLTLICAYAPTDVSTEEDKEDFYNLLEETCLNIPNNHIRILLGDLNAKVGKEPEYHCIAGRHSLHEESSDNGLRLINFAASFDMTISSTSFPRKNIYKGTWKSNDGTTVNQIDHVLIDNKYKRSITDVRTKRGADCDSDHFLVKTKLQCRFLKPKLTNRPHRSPRWNTEALKDPEQVTKYQDSIENNMRRSNVTAEDIESMWSKIKDTLSKAAESELGTTKTKKNGWFDEECEKAIQKRMQCRVKALQVNTRNANQNYIAERKKTRKLLRNKKRNYFKTKIEEIENRMWGNEQRKAYKEIDSIRSGSKPFSNWCRDKDGNLKTTNTEVLEVWKNYFTELLNNDNTEPYVLEDNENWRNTRNNTVEEPTYEEIRESIMSLKNNKAPGEDGIPAELLKHGGEALYETIHALVLEVWRKEKIPRDWKIGIICPIFKKGDRTICSNYRGISLLNTTYKVLAHFLRQRLQVFAERGMGNYQAGFRPGRSTTGQIFGLRQLMEKAYEYGIDLHNIFIDFKKAYDSVQHKSVWQALVYYQVPPKLRNLIMETITETSYKIKLGNETTDEISSNVGLRQGDSLSPVLFNMVLDRIIKENPIQHNHYLFRNRGQILGYADDITIVSTSDRILAESYTNLKDRARAEGLIINEHKTKYLKVSRTQQELPSPTIRQLQIEQVPTFKYLGSTVDTKNNLSTEIKTRIFAANRAYFALSKLFRSPHLSKNTKVKLYKTIVRPILTYGSETWTLLQEHEEQLRIFERKVLRRIYGPICENGLWRIRRNEELRALYDEADVVGFVKSGRIRWLGHMYRTPRDDNIRRLFESKPNISRPRGRPKKKYIDSVYKDLQQLGIYNWRDAARDRVKWKAIVKEAKTL